MRDPLTQTWLEEQAAKRATYEASRRAWREEVGIASARADDHPAPQPVPPPSVDVRVARG